MFAISSDKDSDTRTLSCKISFSSHVCCETIRIKLNVEVTIIHDDCNPNHLRNWTNA